ncbi:MAG: tRNA (N(6)-L-threonylcarbamoyladenosine(37)-C(2))-methylthiotransferase, partial [Thermoplasmata archaeon]
MRVYIETYGCAANQGDASIMQGILVEKGHQIVSDVGQADAIILNTCTVIDTTQQRMINRIKKLMREGKTLIVAGCMASSQAEIVKKIAKDAILLPPRSVVYVDDALKGRDGFSESSKAGIPRAIKIKLNIPIADGCLYNCSYCITKIARGNLTSYPADLLVADIKKAVKEGCKEIRLTAQDTASYGRDIGRSLPELINMVANIEGEFRVRVGMMHPLSAYNILDDLLDSFNNKKVYKFLHLPLQSASPKILRKMRRGYTFEHFMEIIEAFRKKFADITIATDVIVAFPGEEKEDFEHTLNALLEIEPDVINITRFSPRPGTDSWKMKRMPTQIAKERSRILSSIAQEIAYKRNRKLIGKKVNALFLEEYKNWKVGKTDSYKSVFSKNASIGDFMKV